MAPRRLFISFSGGETSARMTRLLLTKWRDRYDEVVTVFANTGEEDEKTLEFVHNCDQAFGFNTVWVESVVHHGERKGSTHRVVTFETASRKGEPFEESIKKFGIPNNKFPHCTRELKQRPMYSFIRSLGWKIGTFDVAIGIRADEPSRRAGNAAEQRIVYPLLDWLPTTKPQVNSFWAKQPFRLGLRGYQGNCRWCWKKSMRKHMTILDDDPTIFDFPERMEREYGLVGPEFSKGVTAPGYRRTFFRGNVSAASLREMYATIWDHRRVEDDAIIYDDDDEPADGGCSESCEVDWEEILIGDIEDDDLFGDLPSV